MDCLMLLMSAAAQSVMRDTLAHTVLPFLRTCVLSLSIAHFLIGIISQCSRSFLFFFCLSMAAGGKYSWRIPTITQCPHLQTHSGTLECNQLILQEWILLTARTFLLLQSQCSYPTRTSSLDVAAGFPFHLYVSVQCTRPLLLY